MLRSTFSTTTMASSTTMPMASTRPKSESALIEKPKRYMMPNVPMTETGTASSGMIDARQVCRKTMTTMTTSRIAMSSVSMTAWIEARTNWVGIVDDLVGHALGHVLRQLSHGGADLVGDLERVGAGRLEDGDGDGGLVVEQRAEGIFAGAELDAGDVAQARDGAVGRGADDDVAEFLRRGQPALRVDGNLVIDAGRVGRGADDARRDVDVLVADGVDDIARRRGRARRSCAGRARCAWRSRRSRTGARRRCRAAARAGP